MPRKVEPCGGQSRLRAHSPKTFVLTMRGAGVMLTGHAGTQRRIDDILSLAPVGSGCSLSNTQHCRGSGSRWRVTRTRTTGSFDVAMMAIYLRRWAHRRGLGVWSGKPWQTR